MDIRNHHPITLLFDEMQAQAEGEGVAFTDTLGDDLPPYPILLPSLLDWICTAEAIESPYLESYEVLLFHALQSMRVELRQSVNDAHVCWEQVLALLNEALAEGGNSLLCQSMLHTLAELDFPLPETLIEQVGQWHYQEYQRLSDAGMEEDQCNQPETILNEMVATLEPESAVDVYEVLKVEYYYLPVDVLNLLLQQLLRAQQSMLREAGLLFLLHPRALLRDQILSLLPQAGILEGLDACGRDRLVMLRNWLPVTQGKKLDPVIKQLRLRNLPSSDDNIISFSNTQLWACAMDGSGAIAVMLMKPEAQHYRISGLILKECVGIVDCWQSSLQTKTDAKQVSKELLKRFPHYLPVSRDYLEQLIPHYLALNCDSGEIPEPAVLEWLVQLGRGLWQPNTLNPLAWLRDVQPELDHLDHNVAFSRCDKWFNDYQETLCWFENDDLSWDTAVQIVEEQCEAQTDIVALLMEPHRQKWRDRFVQLAIRAQCNTQKKTNPQWQDFALLAKSLECGAPISELPILPSVAEETLRLATLEQLESVMLEDAIDD